MGGIGNATGGTGKTGGVGDLLAAAGPQATLEAKVERLTKLVHILWKEAERLESVVQVIPEGLRIKTGFSEVTVLRNGGIVISGQRIHLKSATKSELYL